MHRLRLCRLVSTEARNARVGNLNWGGAACNGETAIHQSDTLGIARCGSVLIDEAVFGLADPASDLLVLLSHDDPLHFVAPRHERLALFLIVRQRQRGSGGSVG